MTLQHQCSKLCESSFFVVVRATHCIAAHKSSLREQLTVAALPLAANAGYYYHAIHVVCNRWPSRFPK
jgi:hypothetical protein